MSEVEQSVNVEKTLENLELIHGLVWEIDDMIRNRWDPYLGRRGSIKLKTHFRMKFSTELDPNTPGMDTSSVIGSVFRGHISKTLLYSAISNNPELERQTQEFFNAYFGPVRGTAHYMLTEYLATALTELHVIHGKYYEYAKEHFLMPDYDVHERSMEHVEALKARSSEIIELIAYQMNSMDQRLDNMMELSRTRGVTRERLYRDFVGYELGTWLAKGEIPEDMKDRVLANDPKSYRDPWILIARWQIYIENVIEDIQYVIDHVLKPNVHSNDAGMFPETLDYYSISFPSLVDYTRKQPSRFAAWKVYGLSHSAAKFLDEAHERLDAAFGLAAMIRDPTNDQYVFEHVVVPISAKVTESYQASQDAFVNGLIAMMNTKLAQLESVNEMYNSLRERANADVVAAYQGHHESVEDYFQEQRELILKHAHDPKQLKSLRKIYIKGLENGEYRESLNKMLVLMTRWIQSSHPETPPVAKRMRIGERLRHLLLLDPTDT